MMAKCKDCLHYHACMMMFEATWGERPKIGEGDGQCDTFADRSRYVVREKGEWQYTEDIDEDNNIQAYCSACGAGDKHATSMVGKVPYCWKCGADMRKGENDGGL